MFDRRLVEAWRSSWLPPRKILPSEWAAQFRIMPPGVTGEPGKYRIERTPYAKFILDAFAEPGVEEIWIVAAPQTGKSTIMENIVGYFIDNDPDNMLLVRPSEQAAEESMRERILPLIRSTPSLARHLSNVANETQLKSLKLTNGMSIYMGWAGSAQSLASRRCRYIGHDEIDKYPATAGKEADPIELANQRAVTAEHRRRVFGASTPTFADCGIWKLYQGCADKRRFVVPCPRCGEYQELAWTQVRWAKLPISDKAKLADEIEKSRLAWYECIACGSRIEESDRIRMIANLQCLSEGQTITKAGKIIGEKPKATRVGFKLSALYSPWRRMYQVVRAFLLADGDYAGTMIFRNQYLAEPMEVVVASGDASGIRDKPMQGKPGVCPDWATSVFATADTQKDWFKLVVRAWGPQYRSQLLLEVECRTFDELHRLAFESTFSHPIYGSIKASHLMIDSGGNRTSEVYQFAGRDPGRILPSKGSSHSMRKPYSITLLDNRLQLYILDTEYFKDMLIRLINDSDDSLWQIYDGASDRYLQEMQNEHKVIVPGTSKARWQKKTSSARVEAWDCEVMQCAMAEMASLGTVEDTRGATRQPAIDNAATTIAASDWINRKRSW